MKFKRSLTPLEKVYPVRKYFSNGVTGFTLIELIMTIVAVSIISIPLSLLISQYIDSSLHNKNLTFALSLARLEQEKLFTMNYQDVNTASFSQYEGFPYDLERDVIYEAGGPVSANSLKRIEVKVCPMGKTEILTKLLTFRAKNVSFY